ncbi:HLH-domain-containing protein [Auriscalpium vulgare]|uniref:HLH-domain-containing protein n=1 Tax=Auriscalpium vulgare TaxID=40419 RepID=A0ACB8RYH9_9AGAM|nr:HLH-domain-containing protein [Auriscalpium vulgare]
MSSTAFFPPPSSYKPQIRQEGFHLPSPPPSIPSPAPASAPGAAAAFDPNNLFGAFALPESFRKGAHPDGAPSMDFSDELATLMAHDRPAHAHTPERAPHHAQDHAGGYRHNLFDLSAPAAAYPPAPAHTQQYALQPHLPPFPDPYAAPPSPPHAAPPPHFNSTLPALSSSLRYTDPRDPPPQHHHHQQQQQQQQHQQQQAAQQAASYGARSPSRSRSRGVGPARTTRAKRGSVSSVSPPRHPVLIPHRPSLALHTGAGGGWAQEFALPTPESLGGAGGGFGSYTSVGGTPGGAGISPKELGEGMDAAAKQAAIANEKRRRRRESHNAVERRRRDNINEKISELATLIPECLLDPAAPGPTPTSPGPDDALFPGLSALASPKDEGPDGSVARGPDMKDDAVVKANKGMILRKSVEYIRYLQQLVSAQATRNRELEAQLSTLRGADSSSSAAGSSPSPPDASSSLTSSLTSASLTSASTSFALDAPHKWDLGLADVHEAGEGEPLDDVDMDGDASGGEDERERERDDGLRGRARRRAEGVRVKEEGMEVS